MHQIDTDRAPPLKSNTLTCSLKYHVPSGSTLGPDLLPSCTAHIVYQISLKSLCEVFFTLFQNQKVSLSRRLLRFLSQKTEKTQRKTKSNPHISDCPKLEMGAYTRKTTQPPGPWARCSLFRQSSPYSCLVSSGHPPAKLHPGDAVGEITSSKIAQHLFGPGLSHVVAELIQPHPSFMELLLED